ncbi:hypothetical protein ABZ782_03880 [Streptomyces asoensis]|uniref:hypothetical protein n=1 Tax=Streptomyces asoensis TaxID=249586 RepID=UPI0033FF7304
MNGRPEIGTLMRDTARGKFGEFRAHERGEVFLRPVGGGREWSVSPSFVRQATYAETKRLRERPGEVQ